jgi:V8-like Glu-specific endopeptidase
MKNLNSHHRLGRSIHYCYAVLVVALIMISPGILTAQISGMQRHFEAYRWSSSDSERLKNAGADHIVEIPAANSLRIYFSEVKLKGASYVLLTSLEDGASQRLNASTLAHWENTSAYFNGNKVSVKLVRSKDDASASFKITQVEVGDIPVSTKSQCGPQDNRVPSNDAAVGRIVPVGCTGWIITNGKIVTAGHCAGNSLQVLQFNVPTSNSNGSIRHPGPEHQYAVKSGSVKQGTDWAVFEVNANSVTGKTAINAQGKSFNVVRVNSAGTIRITGYGVDSGSSNQTQQTHTGPLASITSTKIHYATDTEGGNSGSPIIDESTGNAIGVHTHGGCSTSGGSNSGTNARLQAFWDAMALGGGTNTVATLYQHCNYEGYAVPLEVGVYTLSALIGKGMQKDNDVSSLRVNAGYRVILFDGDNMTGASVTKTAADNCLVDDGFNDRTTSVRVEQTTAFRESVSESEIFKTYPNPSRGLLNITEGAKAEQVQLINADGNLIKSWTSIGESSINISDIKPGTYWIRVTGKGERRIEKIVIE